jgi:hypothetical protein
MVLLYLKGSLYIIVLILVWICFGYSQVNVFIFYHCIEYVDDCIVASMASGVISFVKSI